MSLPPRQPKATLLPVENPAEASVGAQSPSTSPVVESTKFPKDLGFVSIRSMGRGTPTLSVDKMEFPFYFDGYIDVDGAYLLGTGVHEVKLEDISVPTGCIGVVWPSFSLLQMGVVMSPSSVFYDTHTGHGIAYIFVPYQAKIFKGVKLFTMTFHPVI